jgi:hypothetical protein
MASDTFGSSLLAWDTLVNEQYPLMHDLHLVEPIFRKHGNRSFLLDVSQTYSRTSTDTNNSPSIE